ncbi:hypothetical protein [Pararhodobacter sp.]|uniref:hypothetical protein n=1 Tax=Pararhodobacter sp. TaxID=2127056 RepID=UPI002FDE0E2A
MTYRAGDYLTVLPRNPASQVGLALRRFGLAADALVVIESARSGAGLPVGHPVACGELLASYVELAQPAARAQIATVYVCGDGLDMAPAVRETLIKA